MPKRIRYFLEAIFVKALFIFFQWFPLEKASDIGAYIAKIIGPKLPVHKIAQKNLMLAMPELTEKERETVLRGMWDNLGRVCGEFPHMGKMPYAEYQKNITIENIEIFHKVVSQKNGGLFFSGHFANWEIVPKTMAIYFDTPPALVYRPANNPYIETLIHSVRKYYQSDTIRKGIVGARKAVKLLQDKKYIGLLTDQKTNDGIAVPFFNHNAMTTHTVALLAYKFRCPIIPMQVIREEKTRFRVVIHPPLSISYTSNKEKDTYAIIKAMNELFETWVIQHPEQWFWVHRRWPKQIYSE